MILISLQINDTKQDNNTLSEEQQKIFNAVVYDRKSTFITGKAGTGKSFLLRKIIYNIKDVQQKNIIVCAPSAIAAQNIDGLTFHSVFSINPFIKQLDQQDIENMTEQQEQQYLINKYYNGKKPDQAKPQIMKLKEADILIIDEISQLQPELFKLCDYRLRDIKQNQEQYFGGMQIVLCGDFMQLPPILQQQDNCQIKEFLFDTKQFQKGIELKCKLEQNHRQIGDEEFQKILNEIRNGKLSWQSIVALKNREQNEYQLNEQQKIELQQYQQKFEEQQIQNARQYYQNLYEIQHYILPLDILCNKLCICKQILLQSKNQNFVQKSLPIRLYTNNFKVDDYNNMMIYSMNQDIYKFIPYGIQGKDQNNKNNDQVTIVCKNAQVMIRRNINQDEGLINGAIGTVVSINIPQQKQHQKVQNNSLIWNENKKYYEYQLTKNNIVGLSITVQINDKNYDIKPYVDNNNKKEIIQSISFPLTLAYAMTIHKSQGKSFDKVIIDIGDCFDDGQIYVALSRVRSLKGLTILNIDFDKIKTNRYCLEYMEQVQNVSQM